MESRFLKKNERGGEVLTALKAREWLAITVVIITLTGLTALTHFNGSSSGTAQSESLLPHQRHRVEVIVKGEVLLPGTYLIPGEIKMKELLDIAGALSEAELGKLRPESVIRKSRVLNIGQKEQITVYLTGAVKTGGALRVLKGTTFQELLKKVELDEQADVEGVKGGRRLKENEVIDIPFRKVL